MGHDRVAHGQAGFGALAGRSETALGQMVDRLERAGFLQGRTLEHGGMVLELTPAGQAALQDPAALDGIQRCRQLRRDAGTRDHPGFCLRPAFSGGWF